MVYGEIIKLSQEIIGINPEIYVDKRKQNRHRLNNINEMDDVLAIIINKVRLREINSGKNNKVYKQLEDVVNKFSTQKQFANDKSFKVKIYQALSRVLLNKKDYEALEDYLLKTYHTFLIEKIFDKHTHATKIQILIYICNTLFVNEKYNDSLLYANKLKEALHEFDNLLYEKNVVYYYNVLNNNYSEIDTTKAIYYLNEAISNKLIQKHPYYLAFVYYNLSGCYYDLKEYKLALKHIIKLYSHASYGNIDETWKLKINITDLLLRLQLNDIEYAETKYKQINKEFAKCIKDSVVDKEMLNILKLIMYNETTTINKPLKQRLQKFVDAYNSKDTTEVISYAAWLKANYLK